MGSIFSEVLPYLGVEPSYTEEELAAYQIGTAQVPDFMGMTAQEAKEALKDTEFQVRYLGEEGVVTDQFPLAGESIQKTGTVILYLSEPSD